MIGSVCSGGVYGMSAFIVKVECDISEGFPSFDLVGMLSSEVKEAKERTVTALKNGGISIPSKKITINLAPANIRKHGTGYDLPIAVSISVALGLISQNSVDNMMICGELLLNGEISSIRGVLPLVKLAKDNGISRCVVPYDNAEEAAVIDDLEILAVKNLGELLAFLRGDNNLEIVKNLPNSEACDTRDDKNDFCKVAGQKLAKRGLEIAAAGQHNVLMAGPPGTGKSMLAKCLPGILPPMSKEESLEISAVYSVAGLLNGRHLITERQVVTVHHSATEVALAGGGNIPRPGLISLAHRGVLFLDEMPEFSKQALEVLRQPLEDRVIHIAKNGYSVTYPSDFMLVGALNPCPCGMYPDMKRCTCTETMRKRYINKLSKPLIDRMDICLRVMRPNSTEMMVSEINEESSKEVRKRVVKAQEIQRERYKDTGLFFNSQMGIKEVEKYCQLGTKEKELMEKAIFKYDLSARAYHRVLRCARTIADLNGSDNIRSEHLTEALFFKSDVLS